MWEILERKTVTMQTLREQALAALRRASLSSLGPWRFEGHDVRSPDDPDSPRAPNSDNLVCECADPMNAGFIAYAKEDVPTLANAVLQLIDRVTVLEHALKGTLPRCCRCGTYATRAFHHCSGHLLKVCDNDKCMEEMFCNECGQVWYGDDPNCDAFKDGGEPCTGTSKHPEICGSPPWDLTNAPAVRSLR